MVQIVVHKHAIKYLQKLSSNQKEKIKTALQKLSVSSSNYPRAISMVGKWAGYKRIRIGNFRVIYWFDPSENKIYVDHIGPRGDIYKKTPN
jgi:mRNA interferase RelE/StbE